MTKWQKFICDFTHKGGHIKRDSQGRINWQCNTCGRWGDPVPLKDEDKTVSAHIAEAIRARGTA